MERRKCYKLTGKKKPNQADWKVKEQMSHFAFKKFNSSVFNHYLSYSQILICYINLQNSQLFLMLIVIGNSHMHYTL